ncbi:MAG TPA: hypothetical protein VF988_16205, partial [Verrucomicrobiae bacterium]
MSAVTSQFEKRPPAFSATMSLALVVLVGVVDYVSGYALFFSAFYLIPVALASWYAGRNWGTIISLLSVVVS